jgi:hypothetical protein
MHFLGKAIVRGRNVSIKGRRKREVVNVVAPHCGRSVRHRRCRELINDSMKGLESNHFGAIAGIELGSSSQALLCSFLQIA